MSSSSATVFRRSRRKRRLRQFLSNVTRTLLDFMSSSWVPPRLRKSLAARMALSMMGAGLIIVGTVGGYATTIVSQGIFEERLGQVLDQSALQAKSVQDRLNQTQAATLEQVQSLVQDAITSATSFNVGTAAPSVLLLRNPHENSNYMINEIFAPSTRESITEELRQAVQKEPGQFWQSVKIKTANNSTAPGIAVGKQILVPLAGSYELYLVYSLADDQANLNLTMQVAGVGTFAVLILMGGVTWLVISAVLVPMRRTVRTAERLAAGDLDARVLSQGQDETAQLADSFNKMADSLQSKIDDLARLSRLQQRFVSDVSHELRTPLTTMRIAEDVIYDVREELNPTAKRSAELLHDQIDRFDAMLADLLEISRIDSGSAHLSLSIVDLNHLVTQVIEDTATVAEKVGTQVIFASPGHPCTAEIDERRVARIVRNLIVNAVEHSEGNPVTVATDTTQTAVALRVTDRGVGMSPEVTTRVFDRFYRADLARTRTTGGTGLGLAISLEDARLSGGTLQAWGKEGWGSSFLLTLPRRQDMEMGASPLPVTDYVEPSLDDYRLGTKNSDSAETLPTGRGAAPESLADMSKPFTDGASGDEGAPEDQNQSSASLAPALVTPYDRVGDDDDA